MSTFTVVIHEEPTGGYWGEVPALPGCYSQGKTVDELLVNMREAIAAVLSVANTVRRKSKTGSAADER